MQVLVAEDDEQFRAFLLRALGALGHAATAVADGGELLRRASRGAPDLVLSDVGLPGCDGVLACCLLRAFSPGLRFVLMTGDPESADRARQAGFAAVLRKPFSLEALQGALAPF